MSLKAVECPGDVCHSHHGGHQVERIELRQNLEGHGHDWCERLAERIYEISVDTFSQMVLPLLQERSAREERIAELQSAEHQLRLELQSKRQRIIASEKTAERVLDRRAGVFRNVDEAEVPGCEERQDGRAAAARGGPRVAHAGQRCYWFTAGAV